MRRLATRLAAAALLACILFGPLASRAAARAGGGHSYSGGSHSSYSGGSYSSSGGGYGSGDLLIDLVFWGFQTNPLGMLLLIALGLVVFYYTHDFSEAGYRGYIDSTIEKGLGAQSDALLRRNLDALRARDPQFDAAALIARVKGAFLVVQDAWSRQDLQPARAFMTDGVVERFTVEIAMQRAAGLRNEMTGVNVLEAEMLQVESGAVFDAVHVRLAAEAVDRDVELQGGAVLRGGEEPEPFEEVWTFLRRRSAKSKPQRGALEGYCPNCGAPLQLVDAALCSSCKSWVNSGEHDWVLSKITQACEWAVREPERDVPGWSAFEAADDGLCAELLEDRASVAFWRFQEALWSGSPKALAGAATDSFCAAVAAGPLREKVSFTDVAVGTVVVLAMELAEPLDRAHVSVRWTGKQAVGEETSGDGVTQQVFQLGRKHGVKTDVRAGLRSARCGACGAPPSDRGVAKCEYCGASFNDGSRHWVLVGIVDADQWTPPAAAPASAPADWSASLSPRDALAVLAVGMAADGVIAPEEQKFLEEFGLKKRVPPQTIAALVESARAGLIQIPPPASPEQAMSVLRGLVEMSLADGRIQDGERAVMMGYGRQAQIPPEVVDRLIEQERARLFAKAKESLIAGR